MFQGKGKNTGKALNEHTKEELIQMVCHLKECKKFGLVWEDKPEQVAKDCQEKLPILREDVTKALDLDAEQPTNIIIEGDNYHALSVLNYTHAGKIDVIYIDPPYNTGKKDEWKYNDRWVDENDAYRHSKWLSFMEKRLKLAKGLMSKNGTIFISIDDNEQAHLRLLCDEIFEGFNFITIIPRLTSSQRSGQENYMNISHDYIICYSRSDNFKYIIDRDFGEKEIKIDKNGRYIEGDTKAILAALSQGYSKGGDYDFVYNGKVYQPVNKDGVRNRWLWTLPRMQAAAELGILVETKSTLRMQIYLDKKFDEKTNTLIEKDSKLIFHTADFMQSKYSNVVGTNDLEKVLGEKSFNYPKPVALIKDLVSFSLSENPIVLDFFAGSGTTGQAVLELNKTDGGKRQFILCTNNENKIAEDVTYPRIKTVITGTRPDGTKYSDGILSNVRYFKTDFVSKNKTSDRLRREIAPLCTDMIKIRENCFESVIDTDQLKVLRNNRGLVALVFDDSDLGDYIRQIDTIPTDTPVYLYVFSYNSDNRHYEIPDDASHEYISQPIPEGVLSVYRRIFQPKDK